MYSVIVINNKENERKLEEILNSFDKNSKSKVIGFDLEFKYHKKQHIPITLQLCFYFKDASIVIICDIINMKGDLKERIINIFTNKTILKIGHGTESMDIEAILKLIDSPRKQQDFIRSFIDTKLLVEFMNTYSEIKQSNLYFSLYVYGGIDEEKLEELRDVENRLPWLWFNKASINTLTEDMVKYMSNDAYYLLNLYRGLIRYMKATNFDYKLLVDIIRIVFLIRNGFIIVGSFSELHGLKYKKRFFSEIFNEKMTEARDSNDVPLFVRKLLRVGYIKNALLPLFRAYVYLQLMKFNPDYVVKSMEIRDLLIHIDVMRMLDSVPIFKEIV